MAEKIPIEVYEDFADDFAKLTSTAQSDLDTLLVKLQANPYNPDIQKRCILHNDELFEYALDGGMSLFWKVHHPSLSVTGLKMSVWLIKIGRTSKPKKK